MEWIQNVSQVVIALGLLNVWLLRINKPTGYRGGDAKNMREEFATYGLPAWFLWVVGFLKITLSICLLVGLWVPILTRPAASVLAVLMLGAVVMHFKVKDPVKRSMPALVVLALCLLVIFL